MFDVNPSVTLDSMVTPKATTTPQIQQALPPHEVTILPSHSKRAKKQTIRVEFLKVNTIGEAFQKWTQVMTLLRKTDCLLMIQHKQDPTMHISPQHPIPLTRAAKLYTQRTELQTQSHQQAKFACVTTITTNRTIAELKRDSPIALCPFMGRNNILNKIKKYKSNKLKARVK